MKKNKKKRFSLSIPDELHREIQQTRGDLIAKSGEGLSLSSFVEALIVVGLRSLKEDK